MLTATLIGLFVQAGFALLTCGLVRKKNAAHLVMLTFSALVVSTIAYFLLGRRIEAGGDQFLQLALMLVAGYILVGAVCERVSFRAFIVAEIFLAALLYPAFARLAWHGGWLSRHGFMDFAGSSVVHSLGGFAALALAKVLGPRVGKYGRDGQPRPFLAHNIVFVGVGSVIVLTGWMALLIASLPPNSISGEALAMNAILAATGGAAAAAACCSTRRSCAWTIRADQLPFTAMRAGGAPSPPAWPPGTVRCRSWRKSPARPHARCTPSPGRT